jgi:hypothetical protein
MSSRLLLVVIDIENHEDGFKQTIDISFNRKAVIEIFGMFSGILTTAFGIVQLLLH